MGEGNSTNAFPVKPDHLSSISGTDSKFFSLPYLHLGAHAHTCTHPNKCKKNNKFDFIFLRQGLYGSDYPGIRLTRLAINSQRSVCFPLSGKHMSFAIAKQCLKFIPTSINYTLDTSAWHLELLAHFQEGKLKFRGVYPSLSAPSAGTQVPESMCGGGQRTTSGSQLSLPVGTQESHLSGLFGKHFYQ